VECPIDKGLLEQVTEGRIALERCPKCKGEWFSPQAFGALELAASDSNAVEGTIEFEERPSAKVCPVCSKSMVAFDFRGQAVELNACPAGDGFWLDGGTERQVREVMRQRERDLERADRAARSWNRERLRGFTPTILDRLRDLLR
jgi:Zn-finger nucleic acid-binding protein